MPISSADTDGDELRIPDPRIALERVSHDVFDSGVGEHRGIGSVWPGTLEAGRMSGRHLVRVIRARPAIQITQNRTTTAHPAVLRLLGTRNLRVIRPTI